MSTAADDGIDTERALGVLSAAEQLMRDKDEADKADKEQLDKLPVLESGQVVLEENVGMGFCIRDGYQLAYNGRGDIKVSEKREGTYDKNKLHAIVMKYPAGCAWTYWTYEPIGPEGLPLGECINKFGMATIHRPSKDMMIKIAYVSKACTLDECFILFANRPHRGGQALVKSCEEDESVFRVYRSAVPDDIKTVIALRELLNVREQCQHTRFWEM